MRRFSLILFLQILIFCTLDAQEGILSENSNKLYRKNSIFLEILGNGAVYSFNYDRIFSLKNHKALVIRVGGNEYHGIHSEKLSYNFIGGAGIVHGGPKHFFDTGIGYTYFSGSPDRLFALMAGYRFQGKKGLLFRLTPMYINNSEKGDTFGNGLWFGLSVGYSF